MSPPRELTLPSIPVLALYAATLVTEVPVIFTRMLLTAPMAAVVLLATGHSLHGAGGYMGLALIPTGWAVLALITPRGGGWWWRQNMGGRDPSERERIAFQDAFDLLGGTALRPLRVPPVWFVIDGPHADAAVYGDALMLSRGLLESEFLPAVIAHELGHLDSSDGKLTGALNRLIIHPPPRVSEHDQGGQQVLVAAQDRLPLSISLIGMLVWVVRRAVSFAKGGLGLRILAPFWGNYWREREYEADQYAARLGQADELADFLEIHALMHDHPLAFIWLTEHTHPPTELRIDRLRKVSLGPLATAPGPEPRSPAA